MEYVPTIGLEIHAELKTRTKAFCNCLNGPDEGGTTEGKRPNVNVCPVCMGHPGALPVLNKTAVEYVIKTGLALHSTIAAFTKWDRKNYFYPDLPKGYQISQYDLPLCEGGYIDLGDERIHITRIHLEEDTGRLVHEEGEKYSLVDYNRAGVPLMELVTEPDIHSGMTARQFGEELQLMLRYLGVSDADMEKGQMRVEANISIREPDAPLGTKVEVKNLNSFRAVERAIQFEIARQMAVLESGKQVVQETRGFNDATQETFSQRAKEVAEEYRYFPEPDLPPLDLAVEDSPIKVEDIMATMPELPAKKRARFAEEYRLPAEQIETLINDRPLANYFEHVVSELQEWLSASGVEGADLPVVARTAANYLTSDLNGLLQSEGMAIDQIRITPENFAELIKMVVKKEISSRVAKDVLATMLHRAGEPDPSVIVEEQGLAQIGDAATIETEIAKIVAAHPNVVADYQSGKQNALQFLAGQVMKATRGAANPGMVQELLKKKLEIRN